MRSRPPNVLIVHAHDLGRHTSVYGYGTETPALREFSRKATVFSNAWSVAPTCSPSRASMLTGRYPHEVGMLGLAHLGFSLERTDLHLARILGERGYRTILAGVQHEHPDYRSLGYQGTIGGDPDGPYRSGFDPVAWDDENARSVVGFLEDGKSGDGTVNSPIGGQDRGHTDSHDGAPWFLFWGLFEPHRPFGEEGRVEEGVPYGLPDAPAIRKEYAAFGGAVQRMDQRIGTVLEALDRTGQAEDTLVIVTSDHGIDFPRYKCTLSPGGLGVQLMIRLPGQDRRIDTAALVSTVDVMPTILRATGIGGDVYEDTTTYTVDAVSAGRSLLPLWENPADPVRSYAFAEMNYHVAYDPARSVCDGRYHYVEYHGEPEAVLPNIGDSPTKDLLFPDQGNGQALSSVLVPPRRGLFDLWFDPMQNRNLLEWGGAAAERGLAATEADTAAIDTATGADHLSDVLAAWMTATGDPLLEGAVPAPAGAAVAPRSAYSSTTADGVLKGLHTTSAPERAGTAACEEDDR